VDGRYPTKPIDVAIEILSDDQMTGLFERCRQYVRIGIPQIFVFDPEDGQLGTNRYAGFRE
jgi:Uma2 family endonuclease